MRKKHLSNNFNKWFNEKFDKYYSKDDNDDDGYGNWLKSDEGMIKIKKEDLNEYKKNAMVKYKGYNETESNTIGTLLYSKEKNYTSSGSCGMDLKQAYEESVIPITEDVYNSVPKYKNVEEYKKHRTMTEEKPFETDVAQKILTQQQTQEEQESITRAFELAKQTEKSLKKKKDFWKELKTLIW